MPDEMKNILEAMGILAEITKLSYDSFIHAGFKPDEALRLASDFMTETMSGMFRKTGNG